MSQRLLCPEVTESPQDGPGGTQQGLGGKAMLARRRLPAASVVLVPRFQGCRTDQERGFGVALVSI